MHKECCKFKNSSSQMMDEIPIVSSTTPSLVAKELTNVQDAAYERMRSKQTGFMARGDREAPIRPKLA